MGVSSSIEVDDHFKQMKSWPWARVSSTLRSYTNNEYDFGLDATAVMNLTSVTITDAKALVGSLSRNDSGIINALSLLVCCISMAESKQRLEVDRCEETFGLVDFDGTSVVTKDELTILLLCVSSAFASILGRQDERPMDAAVSDIATSIFKDLGKKQNGTITKREFVSYAQGLMKDYGGTLDGLFEFFIAKEEPEEEVVKAGVLPDYMDTVTESAS